MNTFQIYILKRLFVVFFVILANIVAIMWLTQLLRNVEIVTIQSQSILSLLFVSLLLLPNLFGFLSPLLVFISVVFVVMQLHNNRENIVISAVGASYRAIYLPFFIFALQITFLSAIFTVYLAPISQSKARKIIEIARTDLFSVVVKPGRFVEFGDNLILYTSGYSASATMKSFFIRDSRIPNEVTNYIANKGVLVSDASGNFYISMIDGTIVRERYNNNFAKLNFVGKDTELNIFNFSNYVINLSEFTKSARELNIKETERSTAFLLNPDKDDIFYNIAPKRFTKALHQRLSLPFYCLFFAGFGYCFLQRPVSGRSSLTSNIIFSVSISLIFWIAGMGAIEGSASLFYMKMLCYLVPIIGTLISFLYIFEVLQPSRWLAYKIDSFIVWCTFLGRKLLRNS